MGIHSSAAPLAIVTPLKSTRINASLSTAFLDGGLHSIYPPPPHEKYPAAHTDIPTTPGKHTQRDGTPTLPQGKHKERVTQGKTCKREGI